MFVGGDREISTLKESGQSLNVLLLVGGLEGSKRKPPPCQQGLGNFILRAERGVWRMPIFRWGIDSSSSSFALFCVRWSHLGKRQAWKPIRGDSLWTWPLPFNVG